MESDKLEVQPERANFEELARDYQTKTLAVSIVEADYEKQRGILRDLETTLQSTKEEQVEARKAYLAAAIALPTT